LSGRIGLWSVSERKMRHLGLAGSSSRGVANSTSVSGAVGPVWSPDGRWIAFEQYAAATDANGRAVVRPVWIISRDGSVMRRAIDEFRPFRWAADSRALLFRDNTSEGGFVTQTGETGGLVENPAEERREIDAFPAVPPDQWPAP
jgi:Tol biopolymer transport system component